MVDKLQYSRFRFLHFHGRSFYSFGWDLGSRTSKRWFLISLRWPGGLSYFAPWQNRPIWVTPHDHSFDRACTDMQWWELQCNPGSIFVCDMFPRLRREGLWILCSSVCFFSSFSCFLCCFSLSVLFCCSFSAWTLRCSTAAWQARILGLAGPERLCQRKCQIEWVNVRVCLYI